MSQMDDKFTVILLFLCLRMGVMKTEKIYLRGRNV